MNERPEQLPEGRLIALALKRTRLSQRKAAERAGMSEGHLRAIISGFRTVSAGQYAAVRAPADTLARIASIADVTPEQLEEAGRPDGAAELRDLAPENVDIHREEVAPDAYADPVMAEVNERLRQDPELARAVLALLRRSAGPLGKESVKSPGDRSIGDTEETA